SCLTVDLDFALSLSFAFLPYPGCDSDQPASQKEQSRRLGYWCRGTINNCAGQQRNITTADDAAVEYSIQVKVVIGRQQRSENHIPYVSVDRLAGAGEIVEH